MEHETILYGFEVGNNILNHEKCVSKHCLQQSLKSNRACIHIRLAKHMSSQKSKNENPQSDWERLTSALQNITPFPSNDTLEEFSKKNTYRLRYERHGELSKEFIHKLLKTYRGVVDRSSSEVWAYGLSDKINRYGYMFDDLCKKCEESSSGGIYRLFEMLQGNKTIIPGMITIKNFMSLIFAFGHYSSSSLYHGFLNDDQFPKTIREFVAKYEFFSEVAKRKSNSIIGYNSFSDEWKAMLLYQSIPCAVKLWNCYVHNALNLFSVDKNAILGNKSVAALYDEKMPLILTDKILINNIKTAFTTNISRKSISPFIPDLKSPMLFPSGFDAVYHPFKHEKASTTFFNGKEWKMEDIESLSDQGLYAYSREATTEYLKMINEIIIFDEEPKTGIDQFTGETILKFKKTIKAEKEDQDTCVIIKCSNNGVSYLLTCH